MNRIAFMIVVAIIGILAALGILRFMSEPAPAQLLPEKETSLPVEEMTVIKEPTTPTPDPVKPPENKQQVMPQPKPQPIKITPKPEPEPERYYEATGN